MAMRETKGLTEIERLPGQPDHVRRALDLHSVIVPTADLHRCFGRGPTALIDPPNLLSVNIGEVA
jgi:CheW-like domain